MANIYGNKSANVLNGTQGSDFIDGISGDDTLFGLEGDDTLNGGLGDDWLEGGPGKDTLLGGSGNDSFRYLPEGAEAGDFLDGGSGIDTAAIAVGDVASSITLSIADPSVLQTFAGNFLINVERMGFFSGSGDDTITAGALGDTIDGGAGNDSITGGEGADFLTGSLGDDTIFGNAAADYINGESGFSWIDGGSGDDYIVLDQAAFEEFGANIDGGADYDILRIDFREVEDATFDYEQAIAQPGSTITNVEEVDYNGGAGNEVISGSALQEYFRGQSGDDVLTGRGGADLLDGGEGADVLSGGDGDDQVAGGGGRDILYGGAGSDVFLFAPGFDGRAHSRIGGSVRDLIMDFQAGVDTIDLTAFEFDYARVSYKAVGSGLIVNYDIDGDGLDQDDVGIQLNGVHSPLGMGDFVQV